jgi:hypothetical protein
MTHANTSAAHLRSSLIGLFVSTIVLLIATGAQAQPRIWRAYPASACTAERDWPEDYQLDAAGGVRNVSAGIGGRARRLHCPVISDFVLRQEDINGIEVSYDDRNTDGGDGTAVRVYVCSQSLSARAGTTPLPDSSSCSTAASSVDGRRVLTAHPDAVQQLHQRAAGYFSEVIVEIPKKNTGESSILGLVFTYSQRH